MGFGFIDAPVTVCPVTRPTAIDEKPDAHAGDATAFAGHKNPRTTRQYFDRWCVVKSTAPEWQLKQ